MRRRGDITLASAFEELHSDYAAARSSRFRRRRSVPGGGAHADFHYRSESDFLRMMEVARDMDRNDAIVGQTIDRAVVNTVQAGFSLDPNTGDEKLDADLTARWSEWADDASVCDVAGESSFHDFENLALRHAFVDGDVFFLGTAGGGLQAIEAHRVRTPSNTKRNVVHGVLLDELRRRRQVWVTREDVGPSGAVRNVSDIRAYDVRDEDGRRQVFQVYLPKRVSQTRGVTALAAIFDVLGMFEDINFAKLVQQQVVSCFAFFRERDPAFRAGAPPQIGAQTTETQTDGTTRTIEGLGPGIELTGAPGEKLHGFSPNVPNPEFFPHVKLILTLVGINLGMPLVLVMLDASETNFSGWRGAVDQARQGFRRNQRAIVERLHTPVYLWKVSQWLAEDAALRNADARLERGGGSIFRHRWQTPRWPYIEPLKDAQADLLRVRNALTSPRRLHAEHGQEWAQVAREIVEDNVKAIVMARTEAVRINAQFDDGQTVHWRELLSLPTPDGVTVAVGGAGDAAPAGKEEAA